MEQFFGVSRNLDNCEKQFVDHFSKYTNSSYENQNKINEIIKPQFQDDLCQNEKCKFQLEDIIKRKIEISYNYKVNNLLVNNNLLEKKLYRAYDQIRRLLSNLKKKKNPFSEQKFELETENINLCVENDKLLSELNLLKFEKSQLELENKKLKVDLSNLKINYDSNNYSVQALKNKISEQLIEIHNISKLNITLDDDKFKKMTANLNQMKNINISLKNQLASYKNDIVQLTKQITENNSIIISLNEKNLNLRIQLEKTQNKCSDKNLTALKKEKIFVHNIEKVNTEIKPSELNTNATNNSSYYHISIEDLKQELKRLKSDSFEGQVKFEKFNKQYADLMAKYLMQQKELKQNEVYTEQLEKCKKNLVNDLKITKQNNIITSNRLIEYKEQINNLKIEIKNYNNEKILVENLITTIRKQFINLTENYKVLLFKSQQRIFNNNNICNQGQIKEGDAIIHNLKVKSQENKLSVKIHQYNNMLEEKVKAMASITDSVKRKSESKIKTLNDSLNQICNSETELKSKIGRLKEELTKKEWQMDQHTDNFNKINLELLETKGYLKSKVKELEQKNQHISKLEYDIERIEGVYRMYLEGNTDDKKAVYLKNKSSVCSVISFEYEETLLNGVLQRIKFHDCKDYVNQKLAMYEKKLKVIQNMKSNYEALEELKINLKFKDLKLMENNQKFVITNRALLRSVKEYIKDRNLAENRLKHLRILYSCLVDENSSLRLSLAAKTAEIEIIQKLLDSSKSTTGLDIIQSDIFCERLKLEEKKDIMVQERINVVENRLKEKLKQDENCLKCQDFKNQLQCLKNNLIRCEADKQNLTKEKRFLQRLCSDLKVAIKSYSNQNQKLKERLDSFTEVKVQFSSRQSFDKVDTSGTPKCFDDKLIQNALEQHKNSLLHKPIVKFGECLSDLRKEINCLHIHITQMA